MILRKSWKKYEIKNVMLVNFDKIIAVGDIC